MPVPDEIWGLLVGLGLLIAIVIAGAFWKQHAINSGGEAAPRQLSYDVPRQAPPRREYRDPAQPPRREALPHYEPRQPYVPPAPPPDYTVPASTSQPVTQPRPAPMQSLPPKPVTQAVVDPWESITKSALLAMDARKRGHTIIAARPGDGKTQTQISLMLADIRRGYQVIWVNPHLALYHPEDQQTDLRSLEGHFQQVYDYNVIPSVFKEALRIVMDERMPLYRRGLDVGHNIVLYIDEWPAIVGTLGDDVVGMVVKILRESRKCNVWIVLATQDALTKTLGTDSGPRDAFNTRILGGVDTPTWKALAKGADKPEYPKHSWYVVEQGVVKVPRFTAQQISLMAQIEQPVYAPLGKIVDADGEPVTPQDDYQEVPGITWTDDHAKARRPVLEALPQVQSIMDLEGIETDAAWSRVLSGRTLAQMLWPQTRANKGGGAAAQKANKIRAEVVAVMSETGTTDAQDPVQDHDALRI